MRHTKGAGVPKWDSVLCDQDVVALRLRVPNDAGYLQPLFWGQPHKFEAGANARSVANHGNRGKQLLTDLQIDSHRITDLHTGLNDGSQTAFAKIKTDASACSYAALAQVAHGYGDAEQVSRIPSRRYTRIVNFDCR